MHRAFVAALAVLLASSAHAGEVQVAVAANLTGPMERIAPAFEKATGHKAAIAYGTVGKFYAQIRNAAPFEFAPGSHWLVPPQLYPRLKQDAVLLTRGKGNPAAEALLVYLKSDAARAVIRACGYDF